MLPVAPTWGADSRCLLEAFLGAKAKRRTHELLNIVCYGSYKICFSFLLFPTTGLYVRYVNYAILRRDLISYLKSNYTVLYNIQFGCV